MTYLAVLTGEADVTLTGSGFTDIKALKFGKHSAQAFTIVDDATLSASLPPEMPPVADVTVTDGASDRFLMAMTQDPITGHFIGYALDSSAVSQIDLTTNSLLATVEVGLNPTSLAVALDHTTTPPTPLSLYVTNAGCITRIALPDLTTTSIDTGEGSVPTFIAMTPSGDTAYFTDDNSNALIPLLAVNTATPNLGAPITDAAFQFNGAPFYPKIVISSDGKTLYVTNTGSNTLSTVDLTVSPPVVTTTVEIERDANGMAIAPDGSELYSFLSHTDPLSLPNDPEAAEAKDGKSVAPLPEATIFPVLPRFGGSMIDTTIQNFTINPTTALYGQAITFSAEIVPDSGTEVPTGTVTFFDTGMSGYSVSGTLVKLGSYSLIVLTTPSNPIYLPTPVGMYTMVASYNGDINFNLSTSLNSVSLTVNQASTTTALGSSLNPSPYGESVTFTATVSPVFPATGTPTGTVQFFVDGAQVGTKLLSSGMAQYTTPNSELTIGLHSITAFYSGDSNFTKSDNTADPFMQTVIKATTVTTFISNLPNPSAYGQQVIFYAVVDPQYSGTPSGTVYFYDGPTTGTPIGSGTLSGGTVTFSISTLTVGMHSNINAMYAGDSNFTSSATTSPTQTVSQATTTTTVTNTVNPSVYGEQVTFTATVAPEYSGTPSGTVQFSVDGSQVGGAVTLSGGMAQYTTSSLSIGSHSITAVYSGDTNFTGSDNTAAPFMQTVNQASTTTTVTNTVNPTSAYGQSVTFTATVAPQYSGTPSGTVYFYDGPTTGTPIGSGTLSGGVATCAISTLTVGMHNINASYGGDTNFTGSATTSPITQKVTQGSSTTTLVSSQNPAPVGTNVTFTATVKPNSGGGVATGTVTFSINGVLTAPVALVNGKASFSTSSLIGSNSIEAIYSGDSNNLPSTSAVLIQNITPILPPTHLRLVQVANRFPTQTEYVNVITGNAPSEKPVEYRIYRNKQLTDLAGVVPAVGKTFVFEEHNQVRGKKYTYYIVSVDAAGNASSPAKVTGR